MSSSAPVSPNRAAPIAPTGTPAGVSSTPAGMRTAAVTWGLGGHDALTRAEPDHWLEELEDLLALLGSPA